MKKPTATKAKKQTRAGDACSDEKPCGNPFICNNRTNKCVRARTYEAKELVKNAFRIEPPKLKSRPRVPKPIRERAPWDPAMTQGSVGFNEYATKHMRAAGIHFEASDLACPVAGQGFKPSPFQHVPAYLLHPELPIDRMLLAHRTGTGKTYTLILILDNYFMDSRSKVAIFPNQKVALNFYTEIMKFPSRYRDYVERETGIKYADIKSAGIDPVTGDIDLDSKKVQQILEKVKHTLAMTGKLSLTGTPGHPGAPIRSLQYVVAGGNTVLGKPGAREPANPLFKRQYDGKNAYSNMIVVMDEFHNLNNPDAEARKYLPNLMRLREALIAAENSVIIGATATPIVLEVDDAKRNIAILRGEKYARAPTNEGFVSYYQDLSPKVFAKVLPNGAPPLNFPRIIDVELQGDNLNAYNDAEKKVAKNVRDEERLMLRIHNYSSFSMTMRAPIQKSTDKLWQSLAKNAESAASKLAAVLKYVREHKSGKILILCHRSAGFRALRALWEINERADSCDKDCKNKCPSACWITMGLGKEEKEDTAALARYNDENNKNGERVRIAIVDAQQYEAGTSFFGVRHLLLVDVPVTWASWMQRIGRALRFCGHNNLESASRTVSIVMFVAKRADDPSGKHRPTSDQFFVKRLRDETAELMRGFHELEAVSVDRVILAPLTSAASSSVDKMDVDDCCGGKKSEVFDEVDLATMMSGMKV